MRSRTREAAGAVAVALAPAACVPRAPPPPRPPPPPLLGAGLGRLAVPAAPDTVARVDGDTVRADIGRTTKFRAAFVGGELVGLERLERGRGAQRGERTAQRILYRN